MLIDRNGTVVAANDPKAVGGDRADRGYFKEAIQGRQIISEGIISKTLGTLGTVLPPRCMMRTSK